MESQKIHGTTILSIKRNGVTVVGGDGQMTMGNAVIKHETKKVRLLGENVLVGFAGSTADALSLMERLECKLEKYSWNLERACFELAKDWRSDKVLRKLEALLIVANPKRSFLVSGQGDVIEPKDGIIAIGSGGNYALAAAKALFYSTELSAHDIVEKSLKVASDICVYTNDCFTIKELRDENG